MIIKKFTFNEFQENTYIICNKNKECIIIDPGCNNKKEEQQLLSYIKEEKLKPIKLINTHCHLDHVFGNHFIYENFNLKLFIHKKESQNLELAQKYSEIYGIKYIPYKADLNFIKENEKILFGEITLDVIFTPGHSPGHISLVCDKENTIISGDVIFKESIGRTDLPGGDYNTLIKSIRHSIFKYKDSCILYPGHGPKTNINYEKKHNPFLN